MLLTREVLRPLTPYLANSAIKPEDFIEAQLGFYTKEETLYGVPTIEGAAGQAIIWNKAHFAEAGLDPEVGPQSFDELVSFSEQLTQFDDAGNLVRLGFDPRDARGADLVGWWFELDWFDEEARQLKLNTENLVWGVEWVVDFARRVGPEKMNAFRQEYVAWTNDPKSGFVSGAQSMLMSAYYVPGELARLAPDLEAGYTWVPTLYNQKVSVIYGWFWVMANNSPDPDNAWQFVEHASTVDSVNTIFNVAGGFPTYKPFIDQADFSQYKGLQWFVDSAYNADAFYVYPALPIAGSEISDRLRAGMDEMTFDQIEAQPMLDRVQEETQKLLDQAFAAS
jgi:multiple sugar transport system substrate-binding protein